MLDAHNWLSPLGIVILGMVFWGGSDLQKQSQMGVKTSLDISRQIMYENSCMYGRMHNGHYVFTGPVGTGFTSYLAICGDVMLNSWQILGSLHDNEACVLVILSGGDVISGIAAM